jgi:hypothetical protein
VTDETQEVLNGTTELDYMTHIVMRLYENKKWVAVAPPGLPSEVLSRAGLASAERGLRFVTVVAHGPCADRQLLGAHDWQ